MTRTSRMNGSMLADQRLARLPERTIIMHPGPMNRGLEISSAAADSARSTVLEQVAHGISVRMAALYLLLSGEREPRESFTSPDPSQGDPHR